MPAASTEGRVIDRERSEATGVRLETQRFGPKDTTGLALVGDLFGVNIDYLSKYLRETLTQNLTPQRPSSTKLGARLARANPVFAGPLWSQIFSICFA